MARPRDVWELLLIVPRSRTVLFSHKCAEIVISYSLLHFISRICTVLRIPMRSAALSVLALAASASLVAAKDEAKPVFKVIPVRHKLRWSLH